MSKGRSPLMYDIVWSSAYTGEYLRWWREQTLIPDPLATPPAQRAIKAADAAVADLAKIDGVEVKRNNAGGYDVLLPPPDGMAPEAASSTTTTTTTARTEVRIESSTNVKPTDAFRDKLAAVIEEALKF